MYLKPRHLLRPTKGTTRTWGGEQGGGERGTHWYLAPRLPRQAKGTKEGRGKEMPWSKALQRGWARGARTGTWAAATGYRRSPPDAVCGFGRGRKSTALTSWPARSCPVQQPSSAASWLPSATSGPRHRQLLLGCRQRRLGPATAGCFLAAVSDVWAPPPPAASWLPSATSGPRHRGLVRFL